MEFYEVEKISANRTLLPEGTMLIRNTPIARTGVQMYGADETPVKGETKRDTVMIEREASEVFRPETINSANGKSLVDEHPEDDVVPLNWKDLTIGIAFNPRRGVGVDDDLLLADILVTTQEGIDLINDGKVELSCGYDAKYEKLGPNRGRQYDIIINHIALVDDGRCGRRCSIGDKAMPKKTLTTWDRMLKAFGVKDEAELKEKLEGETADESTEGEEGEGEEHTHIHMHMPEGGGTSDGVPKFFKDFRTQYTADLAGINASIAKVADSVKKMADSEEEEEEETAEEKKAREMKEKGEVADEMMEEGVEADDAAKAKDSAFLVESFSDVAAMAEIILPGISIPTIDAKAAPKKSLAAICSFRRKVMDAAYAVPETREIMEDVLGGRTYDAKMSCGNVRNLFRSVGAVKRRINNAGGGTSDHGRGASIPVGKIKSIADLNAAHKKHYAS